jgi:hypothetical protein
MGADVPTFEDFIRPLLKDVDTKPPGSTPLSKLAVGDYAVLAWLDEMQARYPTDEEVEADIIARWDTASLHDVYDLLFANAPGAQPS